MLIIKILIVFGKYLIELDKTKTTTPLMKDMTSINAASTVPLATSHAAHVLSSLLRIALDTNDVESVN